MNAPENLATLGSPPEHPQGAGRVRNAAEAATATLGTKKHLGRPGVLLQRMNGMARVANLPDLGKWFRIVACLGAMAFTAIPSMQAVAGVDLPKLEHGKGDKCVDDVAFIRRHHPDLLKHHRDETVRLGIRTTKYSLKKCVECHAGSKTGSVASSKEDFCVACHRYAGAKLDCWDCHATKPGKQAAVPDAKPVLPLHGGSK